ncbi:MAG: response regulator transcription factor [Deltaproteobacteria bacterium]|nr:response regulator transcription factor [Deltaproteobacteria bacterium]
MICILVVDDHEVVRAGICRLLDGEGDMQVIAQTGSGHEAVALCREHHPDVCVLDYGLPDLDGLEVTRQIVDLGGRTRILILTMHASEEYAARVIRAGAAGYVTKGAATDEVLTAVRKLAGGGVYVTPEVMDKMVGRMGKPAADAPEAALSNRELQVLTRLAHGMTTREVAKALHVSISTVETHRSHVLDKLSLRNNSDLTRFAIRRGLIGLD